MNGFFPDPLLFGGIEVDPALIDLMIERDGTCGEYRRATLCPCVQPDTRTPRGDCPTCRGVGWLYPQTGRCPMKALAGSRETTARLMAAGHLLSGDLVATFPTRLGLPGMRDLWLPNGETHRVRESHRYRFREYRPEAQSEIEQDLGFVRTLPLPPTVPREQLNEQLRYPEVQLVERVSWFDSPDAAPADRTLVVGVPGIDYDIVDGTVRFKARSPEPGATYVVEYVAPACYVVANALPVFRHVTGHQQPYRTAMNRMDRLGTPDSI